MVLAKLGKYGERSPKEGKLYWHRKDHPHLIQFPHWSTELLLDYLLSTVTFTLYLTWHLHVNWNLGDAHEISVKKNLYQCKGFCSLCIVLLLKPDVYHCDFSYSRYYHRKKKRRYYLYIIILTSREIEETQQFKTARRQINDLLP